LPPLLFGHYTRQRLVALADEVPAFGAALRAAASGRVRKD
jgi:voltage-gated potassium channel